MNGDKDHKKTMRDALDVDDSYEIERNRKIDSDIAYETLAVASSMGMLGMEETTANLLQLELASEIMYKNSLSSPFYGEKYPEE